ncbi:MAG TPA: phage/plasmid replication protein, II/X family [Usitatibacter sp.]|jgi:hypothetical protein|nr:phage/plasmid replication protein, II/X family [Usitatibacter sp.]
MIDTIKFEITIPHKPFGRTVSERDDEGRRKTYQRRKSVPIGGAGAHINVTSKAGGAKLMFQNSPLAALQGHNVCGPNDLWRVAHAICCEALDGLSIKVTKSQLRKALEGARLRELHVAVGYRCDDDSQLKALVTTIGRMVREMSNSTVTTYRDESIYVSRSGAKVVIYDKAEQIRVKKWREWRGQRFGGRFAVRRYAKHMLRVEVRLQERWLKDHGLSRLSDWNKSTVTRIVQAELAALKIARPVRWLSADDCASLSRAQRRFVMAMHSGLPIEEGYDERSIRDLRAALRERGLYLDVGTNEGLIVSDVASLLSPERMRAGYPTWMREHGLIAEV